MNLQNPVKAIRAKCLDCCCGSIKEVEQCEIEKCALHPFRFGKNPYRTARVYTDEQRKALSERLNRCTTGDTAENEAGE